MMFTPCELWWGSKTHPNPKVVKHIQGGDMWAGTSFGLWDVLSHWCDFLLATWRPGDHTGDLATSWRLLATSGRQETRIGTGDFCWRPLATTRDRWRPGNLATWRPGDLLATCWRLMLATWQPGAQVDLGRSVDLEALRPLARRNRCRHRSRSRSARAHGLPRPGGLADGRVGRHGVASRAPRSYWCVKRLKPYYRRRASYGTSSLAS